MRSVLKALKKIQSELVAPKNQLNTFGGYKYRSAEDILDALKPIATANECVVVLSDSVISSGDRHYVESKAELIHCESGERISVSGYAREELAKKGMDGSQITGASSSYARKYALNGLFAIDDTKDSDSSNKKVVSNVSTDDDKKKGEFSSMEKKFKCSKCASGIDETVYKFSVRKYKEPLCYTHQNEKRKKIEST